MVEGGHCASSAAGVDLHLQTAEAVVEAWDFDTDGCHIAPLANLVLDIPLCSF